jgi:hypothetical protein
MIDSIDDLEDASSEIEFASNIEAVEAAVGESLGEILPGAPIENRPALYNRLCRTKAAEAAAVRMRLVDDCWDIACAAGLIAVAGTAVIQGWITSTFGGAS